MRKPIAILTSDWHCRETQPVCRTDDFVNTTQWEVMDFVSALQREHNCPVFHAGDLFEFWKPSPWLLSKVIEHLPDRFITVYGNHDLPQHNLELAHKSGVYTLHKAGKLELFPGTHWGQEPADVSIWPDGPRVLVWHVMVWLGELPYPGCTSGDAYRLMRKTPGYDLILTGHNHQPFTAKLRDRLLVNPGGITRQEADQTERPRVYLWDGQDVEAVYMPHDEDVVSRQHLEHKEERDKRIEAFVSSLDTDWEGGVSFEDNLEIFFNKNQVRQSVQNIVNECVGD